MTTRRLPNPTGKEKTLLVVDDEVAPRRTLRLLFEQHYKVVEAEDGFQALDTISSREVHTAIVDLRMPRMSGIELLERIRSVHPSVQVLILTAFESLDTAKQALRLGALDYLTKPYSIDVIHKAVARAMERSELEVQRQRVEKQLEELHESLHLHRLKEQILKERGEIYASVIHDLNGPLTVIASFADHLNHQVESAPDLKTGSWREFREKFQRLHLQASICVRISRRYLGFLRDENSRSAFSSVNRTLSDLDDLLSGTPHSTGHDLIVRPLEFDVGVRIHGTDFLQILLNLAINALQSRETPHRVAIGASMVSSSTLPSPWVETSGERWILGDRPQPSASHFAEICVHDDGCGISEEHLARLFKDSFTTKPAGVGTGLGLLIVRRLVSEAGGLIHVRSQPGIGTCIKVLLPCEPDQQPPPEEI